MAAANNQLIGTGAQSNGTSTFTLDAFGRTTAMSMTGGTTESRSYIYDAASQGIVNSDTLGGTTYVDNWYRMGGTNMWHYSNRFDPRGGDADTSGASYTVRAGDTLQGIARIVWGDASLWYKIADANGLSASSGLTEGQSLRIPAGVWRNHLNADTYIPYNPASFIGPTDPSPLYPTPTANGNKCGAFGAILLAAVAIAVTAVVAPQLIGQAAQAAVAATATAPAVAATAATGLTASLGATGAAIAGGAIAGAAGSLVSQGVGLATGIQDKFSWKGVALAAIGGGVGGGLAGTNPLGKGAGVFANGAARGALANVLNQGIAVATGLQSKFNWVGVAVGGAVGGTSGFFDAKLPDAMPGSIADYTRQTLSGTAAALAGGAARSLLDGSDFGDNILAALPEAIGSTIGHALARGINNLNDGGSGPVATRSSASLSAGVLGMAGASLYSRVADWVKGTTLARQAEEAENVIVVTAQKLNKGFWSYFSSFTNAIGITNAVMSARMQYAADTRRGSYPTMQMGRANPWRSNAGSIGFTRGFAGGVVNAVGNQLQTIKTVATQPGITTIKSALFAGAELVDQAIVANNTPTIEYVRGAGRYLSNASAYDYGHLVGASIVNVGTGALTAELTPVRLSRLGELRAVGVAEVSAIGEARAGTALQTYWPPNRGFQGKSIIQELSAGTYIDRYGYEGGTFLSPEGTPDWMRSLAPGTTSKPYNVYEVVTPIEVQSGAVQSDWWRHPI